MVVLHAPSARDNSVMNLAICIGGIYICYLSYGIFQEKMYVPMHMLQGSVVTSDANNVTLRCCCSFTYRSPEGDKFTATLFMLFVQCVTNALVAYMGMYDS